MPLIPNCKLSAVALVTHARELEKATILPFSATLAVKVIFF